MTRPGLGTGSGDVGKLDIVSGIRPRATGDEGERLNTQTTWVERLGSRPVRARGTLGDAVARVMLSAR